MSPNQLCICQTLAAIVDHHIYKPKVVSQTLTQTKSNRGLLTHKPAEGTSLPCFGLEKAEEVIALEPCNCLPTVHANSLGVVGIFAPVDHVTSNYPPPQTLRY